MPSSYEENLYTNFTLTPDNCDKEPIHRPRAIQGHGYMLILSSDSLQVEAISDNLLSLITCTEAEVWTQPIQSWMPDSLQQILHTHAPTNTWAEINPVKVVAWGQELWLITHEYEEKVIWEFEHQVEEEVAEENTPGYIFRVLQRSLANSRSSKSRESAIQAICEGMKFVSGFDRAMVYQFDEDWHGHVVGEAKEAELEPFLGLHYPATDIPPMARKLFMVNEFRSIADIYQENSSLRYAPTLAADTEFDLSLSQLRATSPIHIEYLHNMGVRASFTMAIKIGGQLWGLFAFHHYSGPKPLPYAFRKSLGLASELFTLHLIELLRSEKEQVKVGLFDLEKKFLQQLNSEEELIHIMADKLDVLKQLCEADGVAFLQEEEVLLSGISPSKEEVLSTRAWLKQKGEEEIYETNRLREKWPDSQDFSAPIGGLFSCCISPETGLYVMWFRQVVSETVSWGGNPEEAVLIEQKEDEQGIRVGPRKSFAKWKIVSHNKSLPWEYHHHRIVNRLREQLIKLELSRSSRQIQELNRKLSEVINKEFEQLVYIASHDLQEPLRTITNYIKLMQEEVEEFANEDLNFYTQRILRSTNRMSALVRDLLEYSRIGRKREIKQLDLAQLLQDIQEDLHVSIEQNEALVIIGELPHIQGNPQELTSLFLNLLSNALKYRSKGTPPVIHVTAEQLKDKWLFRVQDNGIGIDPGHTERIFLLFQRLHHKKEFEGTGIGLAQCKKIVGLYGGDIWVEPNEGIGSTFLFTLGNNLYEESTSAFGAKYLTK